MYGVTFALVLVSTSQVQINQSHDYLHTYEYISISNKHAIDCTNLCIFKIGWNDFLWISLNWNQKVGACTNLPPCKSNRAVQLFFFSCKMNRICIQQGGAIYKLPRPSLYCVWFAEEKIEILVLLNEDLSLIYLRMCQCLNDLCIT